MAVARKHGVSMSQIMGACTKRKTAWARQEAYAEIRARRPHLSFPSIGVLFGRDHSTIIYGIRKFHERRETAVCAPVFRSVNSGGETVHVGETLGARQATSRGINLAQ